MAQTISATDAELPKPINAVFQQMFLRRAQQVCPYFTGSKPGTLNKQQGTSSVKWRRHEQITPTTTALSELTTTASYMQGRDSVAASVTDVLATVAKYGQFYILNEEVDLYDPNGTAADLILTLAEAAGRSLNQLQRNEMEDNATQRFAANVASIGAVHAIITVGDLNRIINELHKNSARTFSSMGNGSTNIGTVPILPAYWGLVHPDVAHDLVGLTGFTSVEKYANYTNIAVGEIGFYGRAGRGVRFIASEDSSVDAAAGAALSGADLNTQSGLTNVYTSVIFGQDAFGSVGLGMRHTDGTYMAGENGGGFEIINKGRGSGGTSDPFNEISTIAWKAFHAAKVLNSNWSRSLRTAATNLTN